MNTDTARIQTAVGLSRHAAGILAAAAHLVNNDTDELELAYGILEQATRIRRIGDALLRAYEAAERAEARR